MTIFDRGFTLVDEPESDFGLDLALEISSKLRGKKEKISADAMDLLGIEQSIYQKNFVRLMLFSGAKPDLIAKCMDVKEELIVAYREIFFDITKIRGQLGKLEYYETMLSRWPDGTDEHSFAIMLRDAHLGGEDIVMEQFNIVLDDYSVSEYKDRAQKKAMLSLKKVERGERDFKTHIEEIKARDATIKTIDAAAPADSKSDKSTMSELVDILKFMNEEGMGKGTTEVRSYDVDAEEFVEAILVAKPAIADNTKSDEN